MWFKILIKLLLLPLLAALAFPTAVNAGTWYLLAKTSAGTWTVPMPNKNHCNAEGRRLLDLDYWIGPISKLLSYVCVFGK